ncbi:MAG: hypothetical protein ACKO34_01990 [Vampirovibrionales bacterium]
MSSPLSSSFPSLGSLGFAKDAYSTPAGQASGKPLPRQEQDGVAFQLPYYPVILPPPPTTELPTPAVGALVGATASMVQLLPFASLLLWTSSLLCFATHKVLATTPEVRSALKGPTALIAAIGLSSLRGAILWNAGLGALLGVFYKGGNPYKNWATTPPAPLQQKLFGGPPQLLDAQTWVDRQEIHNAKLRSAAWGLIAGELNTLYRLFGQDPIKLAYQRRDVQTGQRSLQSAIQHEINVRDAQLRVANLGLAGSTVSLASFIGLACFEKPESATFNSVV